ncbi:MAG: hypothetical protein LBJ72_00440 [Dysgonamonadaceae bacterium]|jgi:hypothetical protein|nr:hypothetical protein [Dysgonamonadaceae bacterium]
MKPLFVTLLAIFFLSSVSGQTKNINVDNLRIQSIAVRTSPVQPLEPLFFHYATKVTATPSTQQRIIIDEIDDAIYISGQKKAPEPIPGDVVIHVDLGNLIIENSNIAERREESKDRNGKITVYHYYKLNVSYKFDARYKILLDEKVLAEGKVYDSFFTQNYSSQEYRSSKEASDYWRNNRDVLISEFTRNLSMNTASKASSVASARYGFPVVRTFDIIKTIDEKKHHENEPFRAAAQSLKEELQTMTGNTGMNRERIDGLIEYFKGIPQKYTDPKLKADVRLRYAAYYNLCKIYLYLDEPDNITQYADLILSNGHDKKDEERMKKAAENLKIILGRTSIKTRHFDPNQYFENDTMDGELIQKEEVIQTTEDTDE